MKFTFIANACGIFTGSRGTKLLMDPWLDDGVFEGSWCHYPPLKTTHKCLDSIDAIYLSHIHPDHYDERYFDYPKEVPIFVLKSRFNFLFKNLKLNGYSNVIELEPSKPYDFNEITLTLFPPFASHVFHESKIGNIIDSALVIQDIDGCSAFNANDNTPSKEACHLLRTKFGEFDLAMINYNAAGPYPSCFRNLSENEKVDAHFKVINRNINHLIELCNILKPRRVLPFAGAYVIGGKEFKKNQFLGTTTWDYCAEQVTRNSTHIPIVLRESDELDLISMNTSNHYVPINTEEQKSYISSKLAKMKYPYELDPSVNQEQLGAKVDIALIALRERVKIYDLDVKTKIRVITIDNCWIINNGDTNFGVNMDFYIDERLLMRILDKKAHWNNAEIGCHIEIDRNPNVYEVDAHTMMQFFHC